MSGLAKSALAAGTAYFGAQGIINAVKGSIDAFRQQELAEKKLEAALGKTSEKLLAQASALQKVTTFGDEQIIEAQALIGAFVKEEEHIAAATKATLDLAAAKGMDLTVAADLVSKTLGSSTNALSRYGIQVEGAVGSTDRLESLTGNLADVFGGQAVAQTDTLDGKIKQFNNSLGDLMEDIGESFLPILTSMVKGFSSLITTIGGWFDTGLEEQVASERAEFNEMINTLKRLEPESETRKRLIQEIKQEYPGYLGNLDLEKASLKDIEELQKESNELMMARLVISMREEDITKAIADQEKAARNLVKAEREMTTARENADITRKLITDGEIKLHMKKELAYFTLEKRAKAALVLAKAEFEAATDKLNILQHVETAEVEQALAIIGIKEKKDKKIQESIDLEKAEAVEIEKKNKLLEEQEKLFQKALNFQIPALEMRNSLLETNIEAVSLQAEQQENELTLTSTDTDTSYGLSSATDGD